MELKNNDLWIDLSLNHLLVYEINSLFLSNKTNFNELEIKKAKVNQKKFELGFSMDNDYTLRFDKSPLIKGIIEGRNVLAHQLFLLVHIKKLVIFLT